MKWPYVTSSATSGNRHCSGSVDSVSNPSATIFVPASIKVEKSV